MATTDKINEQLRTDVKLKAIAFLFPKVSNDAVQELSNFIEKEFQEIGTAVLYFNNSDFFILCLKHHLDIGKKEVIITSTSIKGTYDCHKVPYIDLLGDTRENCRSTLKNGGKKRISQEKTRSMVFYDSFMDYNY